MYRTRAGAARGYTPLFEVHAALLVKNNVLCLILYQVQCLAFEEEISIPLRTLVSLLPHFC